MSIDTATYSAKCAQSKADYRPADELFRIEKIVKSAWSDDVRWRLHAGGTVIECSTRQLTNPRWLWKRVFCATHNRPPFGTEEGEFIRWLNAIAADCDEVVS